MKVAAARDLPVMDRSSELTDAFVEVNQPIVATEHVILNNAHYTTILLYTLCAGEAWPDL